MTLARAAGVAFWLVTLWNLIPSGVILYFFFAGLADGSVSSFNIALWLGILLGLLIVMGGGQILYWLKHPIAGTILGLVLAVPSALFGLFFLVLFITHPRWN